MTLIFNLNHFYISILSIKIMESLPYSEEKIFRTNNTRKMYIPYYSLFILMLIFLLIAPLYGIKITGTFTLSTFLAVLIGIKITELHRLYHRFEINPFSVIHTMGILAKRSRRMGLSAISDMEVHQTLFQRFLGYGDVHIRLFSGDAINKMKCINNPHKFVSLIEKRMQESKIPDNENKSNNPSHPNSLDNSSYSNLRNELEFHEEF